MTNRGVFGSASRIARSLAIGMALSIAVARGDEPAPTPPPSAIDGLLGEWSGTGRVLGGDGRLTLRFARVLDGRFLELTYRAEPNGKAAFEGRALYRIDGGCVDEGHWFDSNGASYAIRATCTADTLATTWDGGSLQGTSRYSAKGDVLETADAILSSTGQAREFTRATLTRVGGD